MWVTAGLSALLAVSVLVAIALGASVIPFRETLHYLGVALTGGTISPDEVPRYSVVWQVRTPRVLLAVLVGAGLSVIGVALQAMVRNALAEPFVLGISSGASVGGSAVVIFGATAGLGVYTTSVAALASALAAAVLVYLAARTRAGLTPLRLVLTGIAMAYGFQAVTGLLVFLSPNYTDAVSGVLFWLMGSLGGATWGALPPSAIGVVTCVVVLLWRSRTLDVLSLGDETAASLGVDAGRTRRWVFVLTSVVTGLLVAVSGAVGFVGLIMPHLVRMVVGSSHRRVLVVAPLAGAVFMVWADVVARTFFSPQELPLGVVTALVGVPVFVVLLRRRGYLFGGR
ncbi:FecCD family ABC transporter permease [Actinokineospora bangkokensis]|uniref:Sugar ABC transporter substrate-binding protein n=1 Tax=Actinokineospora bangkokensis TaxID=1193682 RepID=A0A1Q9LL65_9PSEU|nr:iron ABC transporter permease [Actinokineospora bangkokensis]OLR92735.1 sugar ABC transporter substrate-binding protein [Actinokineospora bangkokensis]